MSELRATVGSVIRIERSALSRDEVVRLRDACTIENPARRRAIQRGVHPAWAPPATLCALREEHGAIVVPRGLGAEVKKLGPVTWTDERVVGDPVAYVLRKTPRDFQDAGAAALEKRQQGVITAPTGAGKSGLALTAIAKLGRTALVVVGTKDLIAQWRDGVREWLGIEPGILGDGRALWADVTIATPQSLARADRLAEANERVGVVVVDEVHRAASPTYQAILDALAAKYRLGITATPDRPDGLFPLVEWQLGSVIHEVDRRDVEERGIILTPRLEVVHTAFTFEYSGREDWAALLDALVTDDARNALIAQTVARMCAGGATGLVLSNRTQHVLRLQIALAEQGLRVAVLTGEMSRRAREDALARARAGEIDVLVATTLADEGLDVPRLSNVHLAYPGRAESRLYQRAGRILRPSADKAAPVVVDYVDPAVHVLAWQARMRAQAFYSQWPAARRRAA